MSKTDAPEMDGAGTRIDVKAIQTRDEVKTIPLAAAIAMSVRALTTGGRKVTLVGKGGEVVGHRSLADVQKEILARAKIELDTSDKRPKRVFCQACGAVVRVLRTSGTLPLVCRTGCPIRCAAEGCVKNAPRFAHNAAVIKARHGRPWVCKQHEPRSEIRRKIWASKTPEELSEIRRKAWATRRAEAAAKGGG